jgi:phosphopantothenoylcysteine decarboxylase/phosphopantothenate--cysteine ligase
MNVNMYEHPVYQENEQKLRRLGCRIVDPEPGLLACGWQGKGRLAPPERIFAELCRLLTPQDLAGQTLLVTAGPTREELDPVRFISNHSSGRMGYALAQVAQQRGARVVLVSGPVALTVPFGVELVAVESACQMQQAVMAHAAESTVVIKAAAVADYRPVARNDHKIKKQGERLTIELERNPDILAELGRLEKRPLLVGFAAETSEIEAHAVAKLADKNLDLIVANDVTQEGAGFNVGTNICRLLFRDGSVEQLGLMTKEAVAGLILDRVLGLLRQRA